MFLDNIFLSSMEGSDQAALALQAAGIQGAPRVRQFQRERSGSTANDFEFFLPNSPYTEVVVMPSAEGQLAVRGQSFLIAAEQANGETRLAILDGDGTPSFSRMESFVAVKDMLTQHGSRVQDIEATTTSLASVVSCVPFADFQAFNQAALLAAQGVMMLMPDTEVAEGLKSVIGGRVGNEPMELTLMLVLAQLVQLRGGEALGANTSARALAVKMGLLIEQVTTWSRNKQQAGMEQRLALQQQQEQQGAEAQMAPPRAQPARTQTATTITFPEGDMGGAGRTIEVHLNQALAMGAASQMDDEAVMAALASGKFADALAVLPQLRRLTAATEHEKGVSSGGLAILYDQVCSLGAIKMMPHFKVKKFVKMVTGDTGYTEAAALKCLTDVIGEGDLTWATLSTFCDFCGTVASELNMPGSASPPA